MMNCGISRWEDPDIINAKLKKLTEEPIWVPERRNEIVLDFKDVLGQENGGGFNCHFNITNGGVALSTTAFKSI